jgi:hypothetical protein
MTPPESPQDVFVVEIQGLKKLWLQLRRSLDEVERVGKLLAGMNRPPSPRAVTMKLKGNEELAKLRKQIAQLVNDLRRYR